MEPKTSRFCTPEELQSVIRSSEMEKGGFGGKSACGINDPPKSIIAHS